MAGPHEKGRGGVGSSDTTVETIISIPGFSGVDRKRRTRGDKRVQEMQHTVTSAFEGTIFLHLFPHSIIYINLHVLSQDGSLLAACLNAATLALIDAGIPMSDYITALTVGSTAAFADNEGVSDPLLDLNGLEEQELPFLTVGTSGGSDKLNVLIMESRMQLARLEVMISVGLDGCKQIRTVLDAVVRAHGKRLLQGKVS